MPIRHESALIGFLLVACSSSVETASDDGCRLAPVEIVAGAAASEFVGRFGAYEVTFHSERADPGVEVFPEAPLIVRNTTRGARCDIDGGVWVRKAVWGDALRSTLLVQEFSGSDDQLVLHDTISCARVALFDVAGARWRVGPGAVEIGRKCRGETPDTCEQRRHVALDGHCRPQAGAKQS